MRTTTLLAFLALLPSCGQGSSDRLMLEMHESPDLPQLVQISDRLWSGGQPKTARAFDALRDLGIRTLVSVDGALPDLESAESRGMQYVHIPIGYDGVPEDASAAIYRVMREAPKPVYFHCHHGRHRGPAAAAVAFRADIAADGVVAQEILTACETSPDYPGLWESVLRFQAPAEGAALPELVSQAKVDNLAVAMAQLDRTWDRVKILAKAGWRATPDHPDLDPEQETLILLQNLATCADPVGAEAPADLKRGLIDAVRSAGDLHLAVSADDGDAAASAFSKVKESCKRCHVAFRN